MPPRGDVRGAAPGFGDHFARHEQPELDAHAGKPDPFAPRLGARRHVVIPRQLPSLHAAAVVHDRQRRFGRVGEEADAGRSGVERVRDDFGEDRLLEGSGVRVPQIFEEVLEVDAGFAHVGILSPAAVAPYGSGMISERRVTVAAAESAPLQREAGNSAKAALDRGASASEVFSRFGVL